MKEGYDVTGISPGYDTYRKLSEKAELLEQKEVQDEPGDEGIMPLNHEENDIRGLQLLTDVATQQDDEGLEQTPAVSPVVVEALVLPKAVPCRPAPKRLIDSLPDNLTCPETIKQMALRELEKVRVLANRERWAKNKFNKLCP